MKKANILKNITPALAIMVAGVVGAVAVYDTNFSDQVTSSLLTIEPAAGVELTTPAASLFSETDQGVFLDGELFPPFPEQEQNAAPDLGAQAVTEGAN